MELIPVKYSIVDNSELGKQESSRFSIDVLDVDKQGVPCKFAVMCGMYRLRVKNPKWN